MSLLKLAESITSKPRNEVRKNAKWLSNRILRTQIDAGYPLVEGEEGPVYIGEALGRLVSGRVKQEGGGPIGQMEAWMQAEVVAASVAAAHEFVTGEPVQPDDQDRLREAFTVFGTQAK